MGYAVGGFSKCKHDIVSIELEMILFKEGLGYGETSLPDEGHSTTNLEEGYSIPTTILFLAKRSFH
jgi:hypothetical protein